MLKKLVFLVFAVGVCACTYDPAFELACAPEGATEGDRECRGGVWVSTGISPTDLGQLPTDAGGETDMGGEAEMGPSMDMCVPESDAEMCARLGLTCDAYDGVDNCGVPRSIDCGTCMDRQASCGGGGTANVCACSDQTDDDFCSKAGATCDPYTGTDECGLERTVNCGACADLATCSGANTCGCEVMAACDALDAQCGDVDVDGRCADVAKINCGTCGDNASCSGDNQCECDGPGFAPAGDSCVDIDECMMSLDDCDPNATCTNNDGGYDCDCNSGYTGNGKTCMPDGGIVTQVETVEIQIADGQTTGSATLPNAVDAAQSVPFATQRLVDTSADADRITTDIWLSDDVTVNVARDDTNGEVVVRIYVVEFDPTKAAVQSGTFSFNNTSATANIPDDVDRTKAFSVFYYSNNNGTEGKDDLMIAGDIAPSGMNMRFDRESNTGGIDGHWWVVEAVGNAFSVQHGRGTMANATLDISLSSITTAKSLLLYSYTSDRTDNDADKGHAYCRLQSSTNVRCERGSAENTLPVVSTQVVSFNGPELVYRQTGSFNADDATEAISLPVSVDASAMPFGGQLGLAGAMATNSTSGSSTPSYFATHELTAGGSTLEIRRGSPRDVDADFAWQVVDF